MPQKWWSMFKLHRRYHSSYQIRHLWYLCSYAKNCPSWRLKYRAQVQILRRWPELHDLLFSSLILLGSFVSYFLSVLPPHSLPEIQTRMHYKILLYMSKTETLDFTWPLLDLVQQPDSRACHFHSNLFWRDIWNDMHDYIFSLFDGLLWKLFLYDKRSGLQEM